MKRSPVLLAAFPGAQEPSLEEREALYERYLGAPQLVQGGTVQARWLDDGSSFWYRHGGRRMFVDPAEGVPRRAMREDRERERETERALRGGRLFAPGSKRYVAKLDGNLVAGSGDLERIVQLTADGGEDVVWSFDARGWSSDGSMYAATRTDARSVHHLPVVDYRRSVETVERPPYVKAGTAFADIDLAIFRLSDGERIDVDLQSEEDLYVFPVGWREGDAELLLLRMDREARRLDLMAADPETGASRTILTDARETFVGGLDFIVGGWKEYFTPIEGTDRFLWLSERDGWRHVYQYDYGGALIGRITGGEFPVLRIVGVDAERGRVFILANAESRPYDTHLYRANLGGGELLRLTEAVGEHEIQLSPSKLFFIDTQLHQLAQRRPYMDLERVGIYGFSRGGYFALRAMLTAPDVFHVGVAGAPGELTEAAAINEPYMGLPGNNPEGYASGLNAPLAANLKGELMILHGTADVNAPFSTSMRMVDALIAADKTFELIVLPGVDHSFGGASGRWADARMRSFFLEHLRGEPEER